jgi:transcriptional regulator with XRE-family HTH domain
MTPLRKIRLLNELTIHEVSKRTGVDQARISLVERNLKRPSKREQEAFCALYGMEQESLFPPNAPWRAAVAEGHL